MPLVDCTFLEKKNRNRKVASPESKKEITPQIQSECKSTDTCDSSSSSYIDSGSLIPTCSSDNDLLELSLPAASPLPPNELKSKKSPDALTATRETSPHNRKLCADFDDNNEKEVPCFQISFFEEITHLTSIDECLSGRDVALIAEFSLNESTFSEENML